MLQNWIWKAMHLRNMLFWIQPNIIGHAKNEANCSHEKCIDLNMHVLGSII